MRWNEHATVVVGVSFQARPGNIGRELVDLPSTSHPRVGGWRRPADPGRQLRRERSSGRPAGTGRWAWLLGVVWRGGSGCSGVEGGVMRGGVGVGRAVTLTFTSLGRSARPPGSRLRSPL